MPRGTNERIFFLRYPPFKKLTDAPIKHNPLSQSLSGSVIQLRPDLELFIYTRNYMKECSLTISEAKDQRLLYDGPYTLPMFN